MKQELPITQKLLGIYFLLSILITSCSQNKQVSQNVLADKDSFQPPVIVPAGAPRIIRLDSCPPPVTITKLRPPETTAANFTVPVHSYNTTNGLAGFSVTSICEDKKGRLWFGTSGGVSCYDGKSFRNFTMAQGLASNDIRCILEDRKGSIWIGSWLGGISCYDGISFKNYYYPDLDPRVTSMIEDKSGIIWIGTTSGLFSFDGKSFTKKYGTEREDIPDDILTIFEDKKGKLWFSTPEGLVCYDRKSFKIYTQKDGLANNYILSIFEDKSGFLWIGTAKGLSRFDGSSFKNYTTANGLPENFVTGIIEKKNGQLLVRTLNSLSLYNDTSFVKINFEAGHFNFFAKGILEDKNGSLWLGHSSGVSRYDGNFISLMDASVNRISEDKAGNLWFSNFPNGGVSRYNGNSLSQYFLPKEVPYVLTLLPDKKRNLWIGTGNRGIYQLDSTGNLLKYYDTAQGLPHLPVYYMLEDRKENLWFIPDGGGVWQLNKDRSSFAIYNEGLVFGTCRCMLEDKKGNLWFGTWHGLSRLDSAKKFFTNYSIEQGLSHDEIRSIFEDKNGFIWVGTRRGICRYDGKSFLNFTTDDGMLNDDAQSIVEDTRGAIWIGTALGFCHLKFKLKNEGTENTIIDADNALSNDELKVKYEPLFDFFNYGNGFPVKDVHLNAMCVDTKGTIWTGSDKVVRLDYNSKYKDPNSPNVFIQSIKINNENIPWYDLSRENLKFDSITVPSNITEETIVFGRKLNKTDRNSLRKKYSGVRFDSIKPFYSVPVNLSLSYANNNITFDFVATEPARPNLVRYQYMLEGYDKQWSPVTDKSTASFGNMHEGNYTFKLKAQSPDGVWSKPIVYTFKVLPPWYRTWWAYSLYTLIFLITLFSFIRWRVRTLRKEKIILEEKVAQRTHELKKEKEKVETTLAELKTTQAQLIQSEKMASLGELTAGIAHEIQNPLNFVNNFSEVNTELIEELQDERAKVNGERSEELEDDILNDIKENEQKILHHGKRADAIVKGMLQHSKASTGKKESIDINKLVDEYLRLAYHGLRAKDKSFNAELKTDFDQGIEKLNLVPQDIGRVLLNLYNNAFYAVNEKKQKLKGAFEPIVTVSTKKENGNIVIKVEDNGDGISQNIVDKIFQPFFTTKPTGQGTGLGLSLSYDIIKTHGGEIKVETKNGEGSSFIIQLPV